MDPRRSARRSALRSGALAVLTLVLILSLLPHATAGPRRGAEWSEHYFMSVDGITRLHADVLRPEGLPENKKTPVILTVSPYLTHEDPDGPNERFYDFLDVSRILERGYTYVMVDLPGFGGSGGCNDWGGVREQGAVKAAVEWAASQEWSTGKVGMMGKSYDAWTGLMGIAQQPEGLAAVVAMEPVYSGYRYLYNNKVRFFNSVGTPAIFQVYDAQPGQSRDPMYHANGAPQVWCYGVNIGLQQQDDPDSLFWKERDLLPATKGKRTPLFLTQGFLETNTKPDGAFDLFEGLKGPKRAWFGQFDHVRGWEQGGGGEYLMGRASFTAEMMRFFDRYVKGVSKSKAPTHRDPVVEVQDNLGRYRAEPSWPPPDAKRFRSKLNTGSYRDDGSGSATGSSVSGVWTVSQKLSYDVWLAGEPKIHGTVSGAPRANQVAVVYDIDPSGRATLVSRGARLLEGALSQDAGLTLYGQDWVFKKGHRIGVVLTDSDMGWWVHVPTMTDVSVEKTKVSLPLLTERRTRFIEGKETSRLKGHLAQEFTQLSAGMIKDAERKFSLPRPLR